MDYAAPLKPTEAELEILNILWRDGPSTVRHINERLNQKKKVGYTTTLKIMQLMTEKGFLRRDTKNRSHRYFPVVKEKDTQNLLLDKFVNTAFGGSAMKLVMHVLGSHRTSEKEIAQIKTLLSELEKEHDELV